MPMPPSNTSSWTRPNSSRYARPGNAPCAWNAFSIRTSLIPPYSVVPAASAEPDRLVRVYLGVSSIPVRFPPPQDKKCCYLAIAKFKDGTFLGYADLLMAIEYFRVDADHPNYEAELGWAEKDGKYGFFLVTAGASQGFRMDESFRGLGFTQNLALGRAPSQTLGPFSVVGFASGGRGTPVQGAKPGSGRQQQSRWSSTCSTATCSPSASSPG
jgi:hypothetical protein